MGQVPQDLGRVQHGLRVGTSATLGDGTSQSDVSLVARALRDDVASDPRAEECQVTYDVPDLVAQKFVGKAEPFVEDRTLIQDHRVVERSALREAPREEGLGVGAEAKSARRCKLTLEALGRYLERTVLTSDRWVCELDGGRQAKPVRRCRHIGRATLAVDCKRMLHLDHPGWRVLLD